MNTINDFPWNRPDLIKENYKKPNYRIIETGAGASGSGRRKALIFFSSNGIYFPNNEEEFTEKMIRRDYYDWLNIGKHRMILKHFSRIIYVRDIYKQWYVTGINEEIDSIDKLCSFLKEKTEGYDVTTCGSSSGGYMSALMGSLLMAERIIAASAQFSLFPGENLGPFVEEIKKDPEKNRYMDIRDVIKADADNLYYFYPAHNEADIMQNGLVKDIPLKRIAVNSDKHSRTLLPVCYPYVLTMNREKLDKIYRDHIDTITDASCLHKEMVSPINRLIDPISYNMTRILSYISK